MVTLSRNEVVNAHALSYVNRLANLLFVMACVLAHHEHGEEVLWQRDEER